MRVVLLVIQQASALEKLINKCRGESGEAWLGGPLWSPAVGCLKMPAHRCMGRLPPPTGDHKGTQPIHSTALAPTESWIEAEVDAY